MTLRQVIPEAVTLIARSEGITVAKDGKCYPYQGRADKSGVLTIGRGHVIKADEAYMKSGITLGKAEEVFAEDVAEHSSHIQQDIGQSVGIDDWTYGALASFCLNLGPRILSTGGAGGKPPTMTVLISEGHKVAGILKMYEFSNSGGSYRDGLFYRRLTEMCFALERRLVEKPNSCVDARALIGVLDQFGPTTDMRQYFTAHHRKDLCVICGGRKK